MGPFTKFSLLILAVGFCFGCNYRIDKTSGRNSPFGNQVDAFNTMAPSYSNVREHILKPRCFACHTGSGNGVLNADFSSYETTMDSVKPGDLQGSPLFVSIFGKTMPKEGGPLSNGEINFVKHWILNGAQKD
jgi:hypothetical protein